jgi:hypothetical protein
MMKLFINGQSFVGQGATPYSAGDLVLTLMDAILALLPLTRGEGNVYRDDVLHYKELAPGLTLGDWIKGYSIARAGKDRAKLTLFLRCITQSPIAAEKFAMESFECYRNGEDVTYSAVGYAAHFTRPYFEGTYASAAVASLSQCREFEGPAIDVSYSGSSGQGQTRSVWNVLSPANVAQVRRIYEPNVKHDEFSASIGVQGTPMDLQSEDAQIVLDSAVQLPGERKLLGRYRGRIYVFHVHRPELRQYHGFPVTSDELRRRMPDVYQQVRKHFGWEELS